VRGQHGVIVVLAEIALQPLDLARERLDHLRPDRLQQLDGVAKVLRPLAPLVHVLDPRIVERALPRAPRIAMDPFKTAPHGAPSVRDSGPPVEPGERLPDQRSHPTDPASALRGLVGSTCASMEGAPHGE